MNTHTKKKPFNCSCGAKFTSPQQFFTHKRLFPDDDKHGKVEVDLEVKEKDLVTLTEFL